MNEQNIPIDIHYNKLLDWLLSRRICDKNWQSKILKIRELINNALKDMPEHEDVTKLLAGSYINYFHCILILEILKETEASTKNIFGRYSSQRMKDWQEIISLYEQDNVFLAEAAQLMIRNVNYEVPSLKKQISKAQQQQKDFDRKAEEYAQNASDLQRKLKYDCKGIGIEGVKIKTELIALVENLPRKYDRIATDLQEEFEPIVSYYGAFLDYTLKKPFSEECLPIIKYIIKNGNTSTYEWRNGAKPKNLHPPKRDYNVEEEQEEMESSVESAEDSTIDWGITDAEQSTDSIQTEEGQSGEEATDNDQSVDQMDWGDFAGEGIQVVDELDLQVTVDQEPDAAVGRDALTLLDNEQTRRLLVKELEELWAFFSFRVEDAKESGDLLSDAMFHNAPKIVLTEISQVQAMSKTCSSLHQDLFSKRMQDLITIRDSPRYVERLAGQLKKIDNDSKKATSLSKLMLKRQEEAEELENSTYPKLKLLAEKTKELQKQIQGEISKRFKNRPVNIMGEINML